MKILLVVYDNGGYMHFLPLGLGYIASVLRNAGHEVKIYSQDLHHYPDEHLTGYLNKNKFDVVGVGVIAGYYQYRKLLGLSKAINNSVNRPFYIIGGHGPSPEPEFFIKKTGADAVLIGEGEETIVELLECLADKGSLSKVKGIAFNDGEKVVVNEKRPLIKDIDSIPFPAYDLFPIEYYRLQRSAHCSNKDFVLDMISGRGCLFNCSFCYRMDPGLRLRSIQGIIEEIKFLKNNYAINYIAFQDDLLMSSAERTRELCEEFLKSELRIKWNCNGRLNFVKPDLLGIMKRAGCVLINYGIESMDDGVLRNMNKALTTKQIIEGIKMTLKAGISPGYNIIFGNIGDNKETLNRGVEFLLEYDDGAQLRTIRPVTPYPGSPLYYYAIKKGLLKDCEDFYERKHLNSDLLAVNFTDMSDDEFHKSLLKANTRLLENYFQKKKNAMIKQAEDLYLKKDVSFRGFRQG